MRRGMLRLMSSTRKSQQDKFEYTFTLGEIFGLGETVAKYFFIKSI